MLLLALNLTLGVESICIDGHCLSTLAGRLSAATLRQGPVQEQAGSFACLSGMAPGASDRDLCGIRDSTPGGIAVAIAGRSLHCVLQVSHMQWWAQDRGGARDRL